MGFGIIYKKRQLFKKKVTNFACKKMGEKY